MTPLGPDSARHGAASDAGGLRRARALRARTIRRRVISGALGLFVAAWLLIALVLVSGHDPALAAHTTAAASPTTSTSASPTTSSSASASTGTGGAVTTRQS
jgi:hypothetical protein